MAALATLATPENIRAVAPVVQTATKAWTIIIAVVIVVIVIGIIILAVTMNKKKTNKANNKNSSKSGGKGSKGTTPAVGTGPQIGGSTTPQVLNRMPVNTGSIWWWLS